MSLFHRFAFVLTLATSSASFAAVPAPVATTAATEEAAPREFPKPVAVPGGIHQITGKRMYVGQKTFKRREPADPFVDIRPDGKVAIYGTGERGRRGGGHGYVEYASLDSMLRGGKFQTKIVNLNPKLDSRGANPWDLMVHRWPDGQEVMYGAVMEPTANRTKRPKWPDDNWTRRIYAFTKDEKGAWQMRGKPLFNEVTDKAKPTMIGHAYGHHFKTVERDTPNGKVKETWLFHEEVSREVDTPNGKRLVTELFARKMLDPFTASPEKVLLLSAGDPPVFGQRASGDYLIEGPRPFSATVGAEKVNFITFSAADFANDRYDIHFAWRRGDAIGPYTPMTTDGELTRYADKLKARYDLSWVGRADVIEKPDGSLYAVFHAVNKKIQPEVKYDGGNVENRETFRRNLYVVPVKVTANADGTPKIELVDDPKLQTADTSLAQTE